MTTITNKTIEESLKKIQSYISEANHHFYRSENVPEDVYNEDDEICKYYVEKSFISVLVLLEVLGLKETFNKVDLLFSEAKEKGFSKSEMGIEERYLLWAASLSDYVDAIATSYNLDSKKGLISLDVVSVLRSAQYTITDPKLFANPPLNETDVHIRIEGLLKGIYEDLRHKPRLNKPIKNFEPDTGLPSIKTLIEYKFISSVQEAKKVTDEILADTRGYFSREWNRFIYVIYETTRIKPESDWKNLLSECDIQDAEVVVISGVPVPKRKYIRKVNINGKVTNRKNNRTSKTESEK